MSYKLSPYERYEKGLCRLCANPRRPGRIRCEVCAAKQKIWYETHKGQVITRSKEQYDELREEVFNRYGRFCICCGEDGLPFLQIDHIDGGGESHRKAIGKEMNGNTNIYFWLRKHGYPDGYQTLCANCNQAKGSKNRLCIHQLYKETI